MPRHGKLRSWMVAAGYVRHHDLACAIEFRGIETEGFRARERN
jgi:hypothetical protein